MTKTKTELEALKLKAEIDLLEAEKVFHLSNAAVADVLFDQESIVLRARERQESRQSSRNDENFVYVFDDDVAHESVTRCVDKLMEWHRNSPDCEMEIQLNTFGGEVFAGLRLIDVIHYLRGEGHNIVTSVYGTAFSMGATILQAGTTRVASKNSMIMIHQGSATVGGTIGDIEDDQQLINRLQDRLLENLAERSTLSKAQIKTKWNRKNWWMTSEEALEIGLVDEVR